MYQEILTHIHGNDHLFTIIIIFNWILFVLIMIHTGIYHLVIVGFLYLPLQYYLGWTCIIQ